MAVQRLATFSPADVTIVITHPATGESMVLGGFSEDSIVNIERNADTYVMYTGADNTSTRVYNASKSATLTVSLQQTSPSNDFLTALYNYDDARRSSEGLFTIHVKDNSGRSDYFSDDAYVGVVPGSNFSNSMQTRDWVIHAHNLQPLIGGNAKLSPGDADTLRSLGVTLDQRWL